MHPRHSKTSRIVLTLLTCLASTLPFARPAKARVGTHAQRLRGSELILYGNWDEAAPVIQGRRTTLTFGNESSLSGSALRATVGADGYVSAATLQLPRDAAFPDRCRLHALLSLFLTYAVPADDEDEIAAVIETELYQPCREPTRVPTSQLGQFLTGSRASARMRLGKSDIAARVSGRDTAAVVEITVTYRGRVTRDPAAEALPPRPTARPDGLGLGPLPTRNELVAGGAKMAEALGACVAQGAPRGAAMVALDLDWTGHVTRAALPADWTASPAASCLEAAAMRFEVPPFRRTNFTVRFPVTLR